MPLPTMNNSFDDDPRMDTTGIQELSAFEIAVAKGDDPLAMPKVKQKKEAPAPVENAEAPKPAPVIPDVKPALSEEGKEKLKAARIAREANADPVVQKEPVRVAEPTAADLGPAVAALEAKTEALEAEVEALDDLEPVVLKEPASTYIPEINPGYFKTPNGVPISEEFEERRIDSIRPGAGANTIDRIEDEEAFKIEAEAHLGIAQGEPENDFPDWIVKPDVWPPFMKFPSAKDLRSIENAENEGKLDGELKAHFNDHFQKMSILMQERARQMDAWIFAENDEIMKEERNTYKFLTPMIKRNLSDLKKDRADFEKEQEAAMVEGREPASNITSDPFKDIKWTILLDPYASPDDPRFADVARWGHGSAVMNDGGMLRVDDDGMRVPFGNDGSVMAGKMAVMEAIERGWTSINIAGSQEFVEGARQAAIQAGLGAKIVTQKGLFGKSKPEYIMPNPPKLAAIRTANEEAQSEHDSLLKGDGKAPAGGPIEDAEWTPIEGKTVTTPNGRKIKTPGLKVEPTADAVPAADPFADESPEDEDALAALKEKEGVNSDNPSEPEYIKWGEGEETSSPSM